MRYHSPDDRARANRALRHRLLAGAFVFVLILITYLPAALAESPPADGFDQLDSFQFVPPDPEPPVGPGIIVACLEPIGGCDDDPVDPPDFHGDFEWCFNLDHEPCEVEIDDFLDPSGLPDPGDGGGDNPEPVDPGPDPEPTPEPVPPVDIDTPRPGNPNFTG